MLFRSDTHTHAHARVRALKKPYMHLVHGHFCPSPIRFSPTKFSPFWREIFLVGQPSFSSLPLSTKHPSKKFPFSFFFFFFSFSLKYTQKNTPLFTICYSFSNATSTKVQAILVLLLHGASKAY